MSGTTDYSATFALIDIDGDGLISAPELHQLLAELGYEGTLEGAAKAVELIDANGDGLVSLEELNAYLADQT
jgi:Ca2+-binding EF-hand superfamily protein